MIAQILEDYWDYVYQRHAISIEEYRPNAKKEIKKVIDCHNKDLGCFLYECPSCHLRMEYVIEITWKAGYYV